MKTSSRLGFETETDSTIPGKASTTEATNLWPCSCSSRTEFSKATAVDAEALQETQCEGFRGFVIVNFEKHDISANLRFQVERRAEGDELAFVQDGEAIAVLGLFHEMGGDEDGDAFLIAERLEILPEVAARAGVEAGGGLVEQQNRWGVNQAFCELDAALHASGECLDESPLRSSRPTRPSTSSMRDFRRAPLNP